MAGIGNRYDNFPQYSNGIADASYTYDYVKRLSIAGTSVATVTFNPGQNVIRIRNFTLTDMTAATGGSAPSLIACYFRIDGQVAGSGSTADGSSSRILRPSASLTVARYVANENGITLYNPNASAVVIQVELAG